MSGIKTAKIYQFPIKARDVAVDGGIARTLGRPTQMPIATTEFGSGWYHEAAIQDADTSRKRSS